VNWLTMFKQQERMLEISIEQIHLHAFFTSRITNIGYKKLCLN